MRAFGLTTVSRLLGSRSPVAAVCVCARFAGVSYPLTSLPYVLGSPFEKLKQNFIDKREQKGVGGRREKKKPWICCSTYSYTHQLLLVCALMWESDPQPGELG